MDSQWSQNHLILTVCGTSKAHGNGEMEETGHIADKQAHTQDRTLSIIKNR